jgi:anti-sigma factor RsiW
MMATCAQVKPLLGPFDDGELEPHEMEEVALHIVSCSECKAALEDYRSLGVALRDCIKLPNIDGFTAAVLSRIERSPRPWLGRWREFLGVSGERLGAAVSLLAAGALAALLTVWLVAPYAHHLFQSGRHIGEVASGDRYAQVSSPVPATVDAGTDLSPDQPKPAMLALSNDPTTTVIWVPNQP